MSSSGTTPESLLDRARGRSLTQLVVEGIGGTLLAISTAIIMAILAGAEFLITPLEQSVRGVVAAFDQLVIGPLGLTDFGLIVSAQELPAFGIFALPVSAGVALATVGVFIGFLALGITGNLGLIVDNPIVDRLTGTPEEEFDDED